MASVYHLLSRQIPAHIQQQYPIFCKFIEYYYRWLQTRGFVSLADVTNIDTTTTAISIKDSTTDIKNYLHHTITNGTAIAEVVAVDDFDRLIVRYLTHDAQFVIDDSIHIRANSDDKYTDEQLQQLDSSVIANVETLPSAFIDHFSRLLDADQIFGTQTANIATILRTIRQLYQSKGNEQALKYLIKALKGVDVDIRYPWEQVLKLSDGKWKRQYCITVRSDERYWHYVPLNMKYLRLMYEDTDDYGNQRYKDFPITKIEIFGKQSENYDQSAKGELKPFSYDVNENGFDNGYWSSIIDIEQILQFCYDNSNQGFDQGYWLSTDGPFGEDLFNHEINNYDDFGPYWIRDEHPELGPYEIDPTTGGILFEGAKAECTYGRWGYRYVTPFIRFYFEEDIGAELDQEVRVVEINDQGEDYVSYVGNVVLGVSGVQIVNPGKGWQVGQVFTSSKDNIWYIYSEPVDASNQRSVTLINQDGIAIEYSIDKPLIGRVLTVDKNGGIETVEILQYGDHIPEHGGKDIIVSPLFYHDSTIDEQEYQATLRLTYSTNPRGVGYFDDPSGYLSYNDIRLQDSNYWQQFSYDIVGNVDGSQYQHIAELLHPAGTKMFTTYNIEANLDAAAEFDIDQTYPFVSISLFDVAYGTEFLEKTFIKSLKETVTVSEFLQKTLTKPFSEIVTVNDGHTDNTIQYQLELNYDSGREQYKWVERTVDSTNHVKTSYVDSGFYKLVHINYDYHIEDDFPQNPCPDTEHGGYITVNEVDGLVFDQYPEPRFYDVGETVILTFSIDQMTRFTCSGVEIRDSNQQLIECYFNYAKDVGIYTVRFEMPDSDVNINVIGETLRYRITTNKVDHGTITPSQIIGFEGDLITVQCVPENNQWTLKELYYYTDTLGTVYITDNKQFNLYHEDTEIGGLFVSNGGYIHVENNGGGVVNWNVDINKFIARDTEIKFTIVDDGATTFQSAQIVQSDGTVIEIIDNTFVMPNYDITVRLNFAKQTRSIIVTNLTGTTAEYGNGQASGSFTISEGPGYVDVGTEISVSVTPSTSRDEVLFIRRIENGAVTYMSDQDKFVVGNYDITIEYAFDRNGGYLLPGDYLSDEYRKNVICDYQFNQWIPAGSPLTIQYRKLEGYTFDEFRRVVTDHLGYRDEIEDTVDANYCDPTIYVMPRYDVIIDKYTYTANEYNISLKTNQYGSGSYTIDPSNIDYGPQTPTEEVTDPNPPTASGRVRYNSLVKVSATPIDDRYVVKTINYVCNGSTYDITSTRQFYAPAGDVEIVIEFIQNEFNVALENGSGGNTLLSPSQSSYKLGQTVTVLATPDTYYELEKIEVVKSDGSVVDITSSSTYVVDDDITIRTTFKRSIYQLIINPPQSSSTVTSDDGYLQSIQQTYLIVNANNTSYNGPVYQQTPLTINVTSGDDLSMSLQTISVTNPQLSGINTSCTLNNINTSTDGAIRPDITGVVSMTMPMSNLTITPIVSKKYSR